MTKLKPSFLCVLGALAISASGLAQGQLGLSRPIPGSGVGSVGGLHGSLGGGDQRQAWVYNVGSGLSGVNFARSLDNGETFVEVAQGVFSQSLGIGLYPQVACSGNVTCVAFIRNSPGVPVIVARISLDGGASFGVEQVLSSGSGAFAPTLRVGLSGGVFRVAWAQGSNVFLGGFDTVSASPLLPLTVSPTVGGVSDLALAVDASTATVAWATASQRTAAAVDLGGVVPISIQTLPNGSGAVSGSRVCVAASQGVSCVAWVATSPHPQSNEVRVWRHVVGSGWALAYDFLAGGAPMTPRRFDWLDIAASGASFYVHCARDTGSVTSPEGRSFVIASHDAGLTWNGNQVDSDPIFSNHVVVRTSVVAGGGTQGEVAVLWERQAAGVSTVRFAKSLDGGVTWSAICGGSPACAEPAYISDEWTARGLYMGDSGVVACGYDGQVTGVTGQGFHAALVAGYRRYRICDVLSPSVCGGSAGSVIAGSVIPWTAPVATSTVTAQVFISSPVIAPVLVLAATTDGRPPAPFSVLGFLPQIDALNAQILGGVTPVIVAGVTQATYPIPIPDSSAVDLHGVQLRVQGVFLDSSLNGLAWTDGMEILVN